MAVRTIEEAAAAGLAVPDVTADGHIFLEGDSLLMQCGDLCGAVTPCTVDRLSVIIRGDIQYHAVTAADGRFVVPGLYLLAVHPQTGAQLIDRPLGEAGS